MSRKDTTMEETINTTVLAQLQKVRDSGRADMLDNKSVAAVAREMGFGELVEWITLHPDRYARLRRGFGDDLRKLGSSKSA